MGAIPLLLAALLLVSLCLCLSPHACPSPCALLLPMPAPCPLPTVHVLSPHSLPSPIDAHPCTLWFHLFALLMPASPILFPQLLMPLCSSREVSQSSGLGLASVQPGQEGAVAAPSPTRLGLQGLEPEQKVSCGVGSWVEEEDQGVCRQASEWIRE